MENIFNSTITGTKRAELLDRMMIEIAMTITGGNKTQAAKFWGWTPKTVYNKLGRYPDIEREWKYQKRISPEKIIKVIEESGKLFNIARTANEPIQQTNIEKEKDNKMSERTEAISKQAPIVKEPMKPQEIFAFQHLQRTMKSYWWHHEATDEEKKATIQRIRSRY